MAGHIRIARQGNRRLLFTDLIVLLTLPDIARVSQAWLKQAFASAVTSDLWKLREQPTH